MHKVTIWSESIVSVGKNYIIILYVYRQSDDSIVDRDILDIKLICRKKCIRLPYGQTKLYRSEKIVS